jgi:hypothetical protein
MQRRILSLGDERGALGMVAWIVAIAMAGAVIAMPYVWMGRQEVKDAQTGIQAVGQAKDAQGETLLMSAAEGAKEYVAEHGSMAGYGPAQSQAFDPSIAVNASPVATQGAVSIRGADATSVVLVTHGGAGPLCLGVTDGALSYGRVDAASAAQCTGTSWS